MATTVDELRILQPRWNWYIICASIAVSFLGAFTVTQLMCHARTSARLSGVFFWSLLGSLIFGFCSIWSLHEVAMLACEFDVLIRVDVGLTILSAGFAVVFTFFGLSGDMLWERYVFQRQESKRRRYRKHKAYSKNRTAHTRIEDLEQGATPLLASASGVDEEDATLELGGERSAMDGDYNASSSRNDLVATHDFSQLGPDNLATDQANRHTQDSHASELRSTGSDYMYDPSNTTNTSEISYSRRNSTHSGSGSFGLSAFGLLPRGTTGRSQNPFVTLAMGLYEGCTVLNITKGFVWSLAISSMHYIGVIGLKIPAGFITFNAWLVALSAIISWVVCCVGQILIARMESHLPQQILFSVIAVTGVAAMHFTGMAATTFHSRSLPMEKKGFPPALANAVIGVAFVTCITANVLLAHAATVSRNKLAEIVWTRKEMWRAIALKETAEAAARSRSDFIASASHELRTPLHHLQGYSDLLGQESLTDEGRKLLNSIQRALKTLSHITNNVLDWSRYERNTVGSHQPVALDIRQTCESIVVLLPNIDEDIDVQMYVVIAPDVPATIFLDEDWIQRILINLLSNALKFTKLGYVLLSIQSKGDKLQASVKDTGCGLAPDFIPSMWEPFKQGEVRGSARGTGLGLSIVRQLLNRMNGKVAVESRYIHDPEIAPATNGSLFTIEVPLQSTGHISSTSVSMTSNMAILSRRNKRSAEGLLSACEIAGYTARIVHSLDDISRDISWKYIWTDLDFLHQSSAEFSRLLEREDLLILVPYDTSDSLDSLTGILTAPNVVMLQKPIILHTIEKRVALATQQKQRTIGPSRTLRFASDIEILNESTSAASPVSALGPVMHEGVALDQVTSNHQSSRGAPKQLTSHYKRTIMLVEDNPLNQKLGQRMLASLGYSVIIANDGQECIDILLNGTTTLLDHEPPVIDLILMDQSMPRKDGVMATTEVRSLENSGKLGGTYPDSNRIPIVALTAVVNNEAKELFRLAGANDFLPKPITLKRLKETLELYIIPR